MDIEETILHLVVAYIGFGAGLASNRRFTCKERRFLEFWRHTLLWPCM